MEIVDMQVMKVVQTENQTRTALEVPAVEMVAETDQDTGQEQVRGQEDMALI